jgi:hypothetical protein
MDEAKAPKNKVIVGGISAAIWEKKVSTKAGREFTKSQVVLDKVYRDAEGKFVSTGRLEAADVPKAIVALSKAYQIMIGTRALGTDQVTFDEGDLV